MEVTDDAAEIVGAAPAGDVGEITPPNSGPCTALGANVVNGGMAGADSIAGAVGMGVPITGMPAVAASGAALTASSMPSMALWVASTSVAASAGLPAEPTVPLWESAGGCVLAVAGPVSASAILTSAAGGI